MIVQSKAIKEKKTTRSSETAERGDGVTIKVFHNRCTAFEEKEDRKAQKMNFHSTTLIYSDYICQNNIYLDIDGMDKDIQWKY